MVFELHCKQILQEYHFCHCFPPFKIVIEEGRVGLWEHLVGKEVQVGGAGRCQSGSTETQV